MNKILSASQKILNGIGSDSSSVNWRSFLEGKEKNIRIKMFISR